MRFATGDVLAELAGWYKSNAKTFGTSSDENGTANRSSIWLYCYVRGSVLDYDLAIGSEHRFRSSPNCITLSVVRAGINTMVRALRYPLSDSTRLQLHFQGSKLLGTNKPSYLAMLAVQVSNRVIR
jgi:hypothetical protein